MSELDSRIRKLAEEKWPDDFEMQVHEIELQSEAAAKMSAYIDALDETNEITAIAIQKALGEWPDDFEMQAHVYESQVGAAVDFFEFSDETIPANVLEKVKLRAFQEWPNDYEMMNYTLVNQIDAWRTLNR